MREEHYGIFLGRNTVFMDVMKLDEKGIMHVKRANALFPWIKKWTPLLGAANNMPIQQYQERNLVTVNDGRTDTKIRIYPFDIDTGEIFANNINTETQLQVESLLRERDFLIQKFHEIETYVKDSEMKDMLRAVFKDEYNYFHELKPGWMHKKDEEKKKK